MQKCILRNHLCGRSNFSRVRCSLAVIKFSFIICVCNIKNNSGFDHQRLKGTAKPVLYRYNQVRNQNPNFPSKYSEYRRILWEKAPRYSILRDIFLEHNINSTQGSAACKLISTFCYCGLYLHRCSLQVAWGFSQGKFILNVWQANQQLLLFIAAIYSKQQQTNKFC